MRPKGSPEPIIGPQVLEPQVRTFGRGYWNVPVSVLQIQRNGIESLWQEEFHLPQIQHFEILVQEVHVQNDPEFVRVFLGYCEKT